MPEPETAAGVTCPVGDEDIYSANRDPCMPGTADCNGSTSDDCETVLTDDPKNCGACGAQCAAEHTESRCLGGTCRIISCYPGYIDKDEDPQNGCESPAPL